MSDDTKSPPKLQRESKLHEMDHVPIYGRPDDSGKARKIDSIDQDEAKIRHIADHLQRRGYGVVRERNPRAGKIYYTLKALWLGPGDPPDDPCADG
jgi:hypothetical protein